MNLRLKLFIGLPLVVEEVLQKQRDRETAPTTKIKDLF